MNCVHFEQQLDDYLDNTLGEAQHHALDDHVRVCPECQSQLRAARALQAALKTLPVPAPSPDFFDTAMVNATRVPHRRRWHIAVGGALAASLGLIFSINLWFAPGSTPGPDLVQAPQTAFQIGLNQTRDVRLVFNADVALDQAQLTLLLPDHVRVEGYPGQQLSWATRLKQGKNMLVLPVSARHYGHGTLVAEIESEGEMKRFTVELDVNDLQQSSRSYLMPLTV